MGFFVGRECYPEHDASAPQVRAPTEGRRTALIVCLVGPGRTGDAERYAKGGRIDPTRLELEGKESAKRAARAKAQRDTACHEAAMARLDAEAAVNAQMQSALVVADSARLEVEAELARVRDTLSIANRARLKVESELGVA